MVKSIWFDQRFLSLPQSERNKVLNGQLDLETIPWPEDAIVPREQVTPQRLATGEPTPSEPETTWGEFGQGLAAQAVRGTMGASESMLSTADLASRYSPVGGLYRAIMPDRTEYQNKLAEIYSPGKQAATEMMPESYQSELGRDILKFDEDGNLVGIQAPTAEQVVGTGVESLAYLPQILSGGGIAKGLQATGKIGAGLANFLGYGTANMAAVAPGQRSDTFTEVRDALLQQGASEEEATKRATEAADEAQRNTAALSFLTGGAGGALASRLGAAAQTRLGGAAKGFAGDASFEAPEEFGQQIISQMSGTRGTPDWQEAAQAGALGAIAGGVPGAAIGLTNVKPVTGDPDVDVGVAAAAEMQKKATEEVNNLISGDKAAAPENLIGELNLGPSQKELFGETPEVPSSQDMFSGELRPVQQPVEDTNRIIEINNSIKEYNQKLSSARTEAGRKGWREKIAAAEKELEAIRGPSRTGESQRELEQDYLDQKQQQLDLETRKQQEDVAYSEREFKVKEQQLLTAVDNAGTEIELAKAEQALDTFYKTTPPPATVEPKQFQPTQTPTVEQTQVQGELGLQSTLPLKEAPTNAQTVRETTRQKDVVSTFTTEKGSTYEVYADGTTKRYKAARNEPGHEGDSGEKDRTVKTIYIDPSITSAASLSAAGLDSESIKKGDYHVVINNDGTASLVSKNETTGKWGVAPTSKSIPFSTQPAAGLQPLELWSPSKDVNGLEGYRKMHAGNTITSMENKGSTAPISGQQPSQQRPQEEVTVPEALAPDADVEEARRLVQEAAGEQEKEQPEVRRAKVASELEKRGIKGVNVYFDETVDDKNGIQAGRMNTGTGAVEINAAAVEDPADIVAVAVHEVTHALSTAKDQGGVNRKDIGRILGSENRARVNARLTALATSSPIIRKAIAKAKESGNPEVEMLTYAVEEIRLAREQGKSPGARVMNVIRDIVASIKGALARAGLKDLASSFNEADLYRLGKVALKEYSKGTRPVPVKGGEVLESRRPAQPKAQQKAVEKVEVGAVAQTEKIRSAPEDRSGITDVFDDMLGVSKQVSKEQPVARSRVGSFAAGTQGKTIEAAEIARRAESLKRVTTIRIQQSRKRMLKSLNKTVPKAKQPEVLRLISQGSSKTKASRDAARARLKSEYPSVYASFIEQRNAIRNSSIEIMQDIISQGKPLTNRDVAVIKEIKKNLDDYIHRTYRALSPDFKVKKNWIDRIAKAHEKFKKTGVMTPDAKIFEDAVDEIKSTTLNIGEYLGEQELMGDFKAADLPRTMALADTWLGDNAPAPPPSGATDQQRSDYVEKVNVALAARKKELEDAGMYDVKLEQQATRLALEILGKITNESTSVFALSFRPEGKDLSSLKKRENISEAMRKLLGEEVDPIMQLVTTQAVQADLLIQSNRQREMYIVGKEKGWFVDKPEADSDVYTKQLTGETFGLLNGVYTTPEIYDMLKEVETIKTSWRQLLYKELRPKHSMTTGVILGSEALKLLRSANSLSKALAIKYNPFNATSNFLGSAIFTPLMAGYAVWNPLEPIESAKDLARAFLAAAGQWNASERTSMNKWAEEVLGVALGDQIQIAELQQEARQAQREEILNGIMAEKGIIRKAGALISETATWLTAQSDKVWVYLAYFKEKRFLQKYYKALGATYTDEQISRKAAERTAQTNITPERAPTIVRLTEATGITRFMPYFTETVRATTRSNIVAADDLRMAAQHAKEGNIEAARLIGTRGALRLAGTATVTVANQTILRGMLSLGAKALWLAPLAGAGLALAGWMMPDEEDDQEELLEAIKLGMPPDMQGKMWRIIGTKPDGTYLLGELDRLNPVEPFTAPFMSVLDGDFEKAKDQAVGLFFQNAATIRALENAGIGSNKKAPNWAKAHPDLFAALKELADSGAELTGVDPATASKGAEWFLRQSEPYTPRPLITWLESFVSPDAEKLNPSEETVDALKGLGMYVMEYNPKRALGGKSQYEYKSVADDEWKSINNMIQSADYSEDRLKQMLLTAVKTESQAFSDLTDTVNSAKILKVSSSDLRKELKQKGLNQTQITSILNGDFKSSIYTADKLNRAKEAALQRQTDARQKKEVEDRYKKAKAAFDALVKSGALKEIDDDNEG